MKYVDEFRDAELAQPLLRQIGAVAKGMEEVNLMVSSILVAKGTGGELTRVFSRLTETIRSNIKLKEKIATLTLQGKLQG